MNRSLLIIAVLAVFCATAYAACEAGGQKCATDYITAASSAGGDKDKACSAYNAYKKCLTDSGCMEGVMKTAFDNVKIDGCSPAGIVIPSLLVTAAGIFAHFFQ